MNVEVDELNLEALQRLFQVFGPLAQRNAEAALVDSSFEVRDFLEETTTGPVSQQKASVAPLWTVHPFKGGADVVNPSALACYLEYGVGIYNTGPGLRQRIVPVATRNSAWAQRYRQKHGKEPPAVLHWVNEEGEDVFAKSVKGFKGRAMVRNGWDHIKEIVVDALQDSVEATLEGKAYGG